MKFLEYEIHTDRVKIVISNGWKVGKIESYLIGAEFQFRIIIFTDMDNDNICISL